ncbi:MAG TPA: TolC family protein [Candidatus Coprenecus stercoravium]|uniref:TolC family protein n=1 Tax=Candidatus Coprenecus stercoravium TaxID=2840735 RepID=A0A9D2K9Y9_9BACT|nr:TolC family protein [Candidatus Coprenecus stercoravium]
MRKLLWIICLAGIAGTVSAQDADSVKTWTLKACVDYALENNIQLKQSRNSYLSGMEDTKQARAAMFPSLSASTSQSLSNYPSKDVTDNNMYTGTYGINAGVTLFKGGSLNIALKQQKMQNEIDLLTVEETANDIVTAIIQAYMQCLYAAESVNVARSTADASKAQRDRAEQMWAAGSISKVDFAQLESQWMSDEYQAVTARTTLDDYRLQLKQLLELDITEEINPVGPDVPAEQILTVLPPKSDIYLAALEAMPEIKRGRLSVQAAEMGIRQARSGYYPSITLSAGVGTGYMTATGAGTATGSTPGYNTGNQYWNNFNENIGLSLNIPIYSNRQTRTAVNKARIEADNSMLEQRSIEKNLLQEVETAYLNVLSNQSRFVSALKQEEYAEESYELTSEQFALGVKNTVELLTAKNELTTARLETLQAKYMTLLNLELLNIYQGKGIYGEY